MKIYIDYDSTLNNLAYAWVEYINKKHKQKLKINDILHWDWMEQEFGKEANDFWKNPNIYKDDIIKPLKGAKEFIDKLQEEHDICIVTSSYPGTENEKNENIKRNFGDVKIIHERVKSNITFDGILIDDKVETILDHCQLNLLPGIVFNNKLKHSWSSPLNVLGQIKPIVNLIKFRETYKDILKTIDKIKISS